MATKNFGSRSRFRNCTQPGLWSIVQRFLIAFPSSYLPEREFIAVATLVTKKRNRLSLFLSKIEPDINKLLKMHQIQPY